MDKNVYQHESFSDGLSAYRSYVVDVLQDRATYDSERFLKLVSSFDEALVEHLAEEITSIVGLKQYDVNWDLTNEAITEYSVKSINDVSLGGHILGFGAILIYKTIVVS